MEGSVLATLKGAEASLTNWAHTFNWSDWNHCGVGHLYYGAHGSFRFGDIVDRMLPTGCGDEKVWNSLDSRTYEAAKAIVETNGLAPDRRGPIVTLSNVTVNSGYAARATVLRLVRATIGKLEVEETRRREAEVMRREAMESGYRQAVAV